MRHRGLPGPSRLGPQEEGFVLLESRNSQVATRLEFYASSAPRFVGYPTIRGRSSIFFAHLGSILSKIPITTQWGAMNLRGPLTECNES